MSDPRRDHSDDRMRDVEGPDGIARVERQSAEVELNRDEEPADPDSTLDPDDASVRDWAVANQARPDMIEETADGLDDTDEAVRRAAEND